MSRRPPDLIPHQPPFRFAEGKGSTVLVLPTTGAAESFPQPVPLTLLAEAMAQAILHASPPEDLQRLRLVAMDRVVLRQVVHPGDRLEVECAPEGHFGRLARYRCRALRGGSLVAEAQITVGF
ncbi:MAG: hypothetical protein NZ869_08955 [Thermoanaerobaculum sp.]|nr:hypothetical protein [Thermoanaerobaculum sp.]MCX7895802.1 hypothetical protein [Thermoanaerobaculum sp.]MDW7968368.1 hypothetical protein [Thermoanaerobaculum sp.]